MVVSVLGCSRQDAVFLQQPIKAMTEIASIGAFKKVTYKVSVPATGADSARIHITLYNSQQSITSVDQQETLAKNCARKLTSLLRHPEQYASISVTLAETPPNQYEQFISKQTFEFSPALR